jgi:peptidoglycan/LPS O-acetylase OafA/YrhL
MAQTSPANAGTTAPRIGLVNGLRGLAILAVVVYHLFTRFVGPDPQIPGQIDANGWLAPLLHSLHLGVDVFFVLSGFVLFLPYCTGRREMATKSDVRTFYLHRAIRLLPLYYFVVFVTMGIDADAPAASPRWYLEFAALMSTAFTFSPRGFLPPSNAVLWSVSVEIWFSVVFPLVVIAVRRWGMNRVLAVCLPACLVAVTIGWMIPVDRIGYFRPLVRGLPGSLYQFLLGMAVCAAYVRGLQDETLRRRHAHALLAGIAVVAAGIWLVDLLPMPVMHGAKRMTLTIGFALILLGLLSGADILKKPFETWALQVLGCMCYSIYAWHATVMGKMIPHATPLAGTLALALPCVVVILALSAMSYRYIEFGHQKSWRALFLLPERKPRSETEVTTAETAR